MPCMKMNNFCKHLQICNGCSLNIPYLEQVEYKKNKIKTLFSEFYNGNFEFFKTLEAGYRNRAEFGLFHDKNELYYTMTSNNKERVFIETCPKMDEKIVFLMRQILPKIKENSNLKNKIFGIEFVATKYDIMAILLYHKDIFEIKDDLQKLANLLQIKLIARSKGRKLVFNDEILSDELIVYGKKFKYNFEAEAFIQPNKFTNEMMISWAFNNIENGLDFLEMYCGHGNFTIPLSLKFKKVLATEISKNSIKNALKNCKNNNIKNINFVRISSEDLMKAFANEHEFRRLKEQNINLQNYNFSHILVDPPRAGLDDSVVEFIKNYENIIYISCNPLTLRENLKSICKTHKITKFAIFDQFAHTEHIECGVLLKKEKK